MASPLFGTVGGAVPAFGCPAKEFVPLYSRFGMGTTIWSPLASGLLTGKYNDGDPGGTRFSLKGYDWLRKDLEGNEWRDRVEKVKKLAGIAEDLGTTLPNLALAWCLRNPHVSTAITGASKPVQLKENMQAGEVAQKLDINVQTAIEEVLKNNPG